VRFHDLRHTHATRLDDLGFSLAKIANQLGHTQFQTTLRYVNRDKTAVKQVASALDLFNAEQPTQQESSEMVN
jgi:integrase